LCCLTGRAFSTAVGLFAVKSNTEADSNRDRQISGHGTKKNCAAGGGFQVAFPLTHMNRQQTTNTPAKTEQENQTLEKETHAN